jgi:DNA-binding transcriptional regulator YdaS (Cro superfamily)
METGIEKAVRLAGSQTALAQSLKVRPQAVQKWVSQGYVPGGRCRAVEQELDGSVTRYELNPAVFGEPPPQSIKRTRSRRTD